MRRSFWIILSVLTIIMLITACAPAATPTEPAQAAEPTATTAPSKTTAPEEGMAEEVNPADVTGNIITAGSSTVYPLSEAVAGLFRDEGYTGEITIDSIGSGAGFERFCKTGETDIANASRKIKEEEAANCTAIGREPIEFRVGTDAIAVVINPENDFLTEVTLDELAMIFSDKAENWSDVNPDWPAEPILRFAPGTDSGTYDFFIEKVLQPKYDKDADKAKEAFQNASNLQQSEDDNVLAQGVEGDKNAIGFFGYAYFQESEGKLNTVSIDGVAPSFDTAESGEYVLSRPLFIYSDPTILKDKPQVASFIQFYLTRVNEVIEDVGYFPASDAELQGALDKLMKAVE
jgi:phosphate transport system substrate-binding protein